jgi:hypothetical protein
MKEIELAENFYDSAYHYSGNDFEKKLCKLNKIKCTILKKNFDLGLSDLEKFDSTNNHFFEEVKNYYKGICYCGLRKFDDALFFLNDTSLKEKREDLLTMIDLKNPNPLFASILSAVLPGSGQVYSGNIKNGFNSFFLIYTLFYVGIYTQFLDFVLVYPLLYRYYFGGIINARKFSFEKKNEKQALKFSEFKNMKMLGYDFNISFETHLQSKDYEKYLINTDSESKILFSFLFLFYKNYFSSQDLDICVFEPSCSVYAVESIEKNGTLIGLLDGFDRLLRCHSFASLKDYNKNIKTNKLIDDFH